MKIDSRVEPLVRSALDAAVRRDFPRLDATLQSVPDDQTSRQAVELAVAITLFVLYDIHGGRRPTDAEVQAVAAEIARAETWAGPTEEEAAEFLLRLVNGQPLAPSVPSENIFILAFVAGAHVLSSFRRDDEEWWNYLDRAEAILEAI